MRSKREKDQLQPSFYLVEIQQFRRMFSVFILTWPHTFYVALT